MTNWVMIPVPEEYEERVLERVLMLRIAASGSNWSSDLLDEHLLALDDDARVLAALVAQGVSAGHPPEDVAVAQRFGISTREVLGLVQEVNDVTMEPFPGSILSVRYEKIANDDGGYRRLLDMNALIAGAVCKWADARRVPRADATDV